MNLRILIARGWEEIRDTWKARGVGSVIIIQAHPLSALGALGYTEHKNTSKNLSAIGAFVGPYAGALNKSSLSG